MRKFKYGCGEVTQNFLLNYSLFKIIVNLSRKIEFSSEKQKDMSDDGTIIIASNNVGNYNSSLNGYFVPHTGCPLLTSSGLSNLIQLRNLQELELTNCPGASPELVDYLRQNLVKCLVLD